MRNAPWARTAGPRPDFSRSPVGVNAVAAPSRIEAEKGKLTLAARTAVQEQPTPMLGRGGQVSVPGDDDIDLARSGQSDGPALELAAGRVLGHATARLVDPNEQAIQRGRAQATNPTAQPNPELGQPLPPLRPRILLMPVREQEALPVHADRVFV